MGHRNAVWHNKWTESMPAEIFDKSRKITNTVPLDSIDLNRPSILRLHMSRAEVAVFERVGLDLIIRLHSGKTIRIIDFYEPSHDGQTNELVFEEPDGSTWLVHPEHTSGIYEQVDWLELIQSATESERGISGVIFPALGV